MVPVGDPYPGAESGVLIELAAVQQILEVVANNVVIAEEACDAVKRLGEVLHEGNTDLHEMRALQAEDLF